MGEYEHAEMSYRELLPVVEETRGERSPLAGAVLAAEWLPQAHSR